MKWPMVFVCAAVLSGAVMAADFDKGVACGVALDYQCAYRELHPLAEQGDAKAQNMLGWSYVLGKGVKQNDFEAVKWWRLAAEQGDANAHYNLGVSYDEGNGVKQNKGIAKQWYGKACDNQIQKGCDKYRELNEAGY